MISTPCMTSRKLSIFVGGGLGTCARTAEVEESTRMAKNSNARRSGITKPPQSKCRYFYHGSGGLDPHSIRLIRGLVNSRSIGLAAAEGFGVIHLLGFRRRDDELSRCCGADYVAVIVNATPQ